MALRVLVVDDEANLRRSLAIGLRLEGFEVLEAADGHEALRCLDAEDVDLAVVDLMLPGLDGLELARRLRFRLPEMPLLLVSAYHLSPRQLARARVGDVGFVGKPYDLDALTRAVREALPAEGRVAS
ncbi:MAG: response regulator [Sandaracinaceae bacterium]